MRVVGIDPDTKAITWAIVDTASPGHGTFGRVEAKGQRAEERFARLSEAFEFCVREGNFEGCAWIYIERPFVGPNRKAGIDQAMVVGAIRAYLSKAGHAHSLVDNETWKKVVLGNGHAPKEEIKDWACSHYPSVGRNEAQDVYDAICIAHFGIKTE